MKYLRYSSLPLLLLLIGLLSLPFHGCKPDDDPDTCDTCLVAYKPNIYIYPSQETKIDVQVSFPHGGKIIASEPEYMQGWSVMVEPSGRIDEQYDFLFYESRQPDRWQRTEGWVIKQSEVRSFFTENLRRYGFNEKESADFLDWWVQRLDVSPYYKVYPQTNTTIDELIQLKFSPHPERVLRIFYLIEGVSKLPSGNLSEPVIQSFDRNGFVVAEWGVLMR